MERCRLHYLPLLVEHRHALLLGDGDGRFLTALFIQNPNLTADVVDISASMLNLLRERCQRTASDTDMRLTTHQTGALNYLATSTEESYDLIVTHFFLDCLTQADVNALAEALSPKLAPNALWLVSDFRVPEGLMRLPSRVLIWSLYLAFRVLTGLRTDKLPDHATALTQAGFTRISHHHSVFGILTTELWKS